MLLKYGDDPATFYVSGPNLRCQTVEGEFDLAIALYQDVPSKNALRRARRSHLRTRAGDLVVLPRD